MRKLLPYLRIAFSALCGIACLLSIGLWVRSFLWFDNAMLRISSVAVNPISAEGRVIIVIQKTTLSRQFRLYTNPISMHHSDVGDRHPWFGVSWWRSSTTGRSGISVRIAHCVLAMVAGAFAIVPWCPVRFSLRSLLIATTATAAVFGVMVWADQLGNHCDSQQSTPISTTKR
jgi:hypothetical protein